MTIKKRVNRVKRALQEYAMKTEGQMAVVNILTDLRHLCDEKQKQWDYVALDRVAHIHYLEERKGVPCG